MFDLASVILLTTAAYILGSIPSGFIVGRLAGVDVRQTGSGNIGATNVARVLGKGRGLLTLLADTAKGFVPVFVGRWLGLSDAGLALVGSAAFLGHLYPIFLKFHGGKGVATAFGVLLAATPLATLIVMPLFGLAVLISKKISMGSMTGALIAPVAAWAFSYSGEFIVLSAFLGAMIVLRHRDNIRRLLAGTEPSFGASSR
ncbi:MAG TPA: glycerol-3-phosphate 1-O-acyltransferase PlsY [Candidatus Binatia bacterium]|nr:glycerol-3-phosphate 1-O-acyltransferase PlsY [Candidatus Binatia bacterium]